MLKKYKIQTKFDDVYDITPMVREVVAESGVQEGTCIVFNPHTTAALAVTSFWDPAGFEDLRDEICRLIPTRVDFKHQHDTPQDAAGHVKSALTGISMTFIVTEGKLYLGGSQGIYFLEFDGPRNRQFAVKVVSD
ncbi:MAG: secondary thiamine-phosphate synthase enzyme YjbQ [Sphaerochaetaceae bacterium]|nr:secondary thiamine-phosphate synthase enzyme YjbQ [Spirochaetaceae bacterium]MDY6343502.1 secondary thiamine-phosphate synthase enzyme YjbQ [Sphaerochaetaceae bacterium]